MSLKDYINQINEASVTPKVGKGATAEKNKAVTFKLFVDDIKSDIKRLETRFKSRIDGYNHAKTEKEKDLFLKSLMIMADDVSYAADNDEDRSSSINV